MRCFTCGQSPYLRRYQYIRNYSLYELCLRSHFKNNCQFAGTKSVPAFTQKKKLGFTPLSCQSDRLHHSEIGPEAQPGTDPAPATLVRSIQQIVSKWSTLHHLTGTDRTRMQPEVGLNLQCQVWMRTVSNFVKTSFGVKGKDFLLYAPIIHFCNALLPCVPFMCSCYALPSCAPVIHSSYVFLLCPTLMRSCYTLLLCVPLMRYPHALLLYTPVMCSSYALPSCAPVIHSRCVHLMRYSHALLLYTPVMCSCYALSSCAPVIHSSYVFLLCATLMRSCYTLRLCVPLMRSCYTLRLCSSYALPSCAPVIHSCYVFLLCANLMPSCYTLQLCVPVMRYPHALLLYTPVMCSCYALPSCAPVIHFGYVFPLCATLMRSCYTLRLCILVMRACHSLLLHIQLRKICETRRIILGVLWIVPVTEHVHTVSMSPVTVRTERKYWAVCNSLNGAVRNRLHRVRWYGYSVWWTGSGIKGRGCCRVQGTILVLWRVVWGKLWKPHDRQSTSWQRF